MTRRGPTLDSQHLPSVGRPIVHLISYLRARHPDRAHELSPPLQARAHPRDLPLGHTAATPQLRRSDARERPTEPRLCALTSAPPTDSRAPFAQGSPLCTRPPRAHSLGPPSLRGRAHFLASSRGEAHAPSHQPTVSRWNVSGPFHETPDPSLQPYFIALQKHLGPDVHLVTPVYIIH